MSNTIKLPAIYSEAEIIQKKHRKKLNEIYNRPNILPPIPVKVNRTFKENNWPEAEINPLLQNSSQLSGLLINSIKVCPLISTTLGGVPLL